MTIYIGWWTVTGLLLPFFCGVLFLAYFYFVHFPLVMSKRPKGQGYESVRRWEMEIIFFDSGGHTAVRATKNDLVNEVLSMCSLAFWFSLYTTLPFIIIGGILGFAAENIYRLFM